MDDLQKQIAADIVWFTCAGPMWISVCSEDRFIDTVPLLPPVRRAVEDACRTICLLADCEG